MNLVVDTSIIIDYLRGGDKWENLLLGMKESVIFYLPTIVVFELFSGQSSKKPQIAQDLVDFTKKFQKIELTERIAQRAGELYRDIHAKLEVPDYIIAASALEERAKVVTLNRKHFEKIPGVDLYTF